VLMLLHAGIGDILFDVVDVNAAFLFMLYNHLVNNATYKLCQYIFKNVVINISP
jgi:hypothetical protein